MLALKYMLGQYQTQTSCIQMHGELQSNDFTCSFLHQHNTKYQLIAFHLINAGHSSTSSQVPLQNYGFPYFKSVYLFQYMIKGNQHTFLFPFIYQCLLFIFLFVIYCFQYISMRFNFLSMFSLIPSQKYINEHVRLQISVGTVSNTDIVHTNAWRTTI